VNFKFFFSYRHSDNADYAERIYQHFETYFSSQNVFIDKEIRISDDWLATVRSEIQSSDALVVIIGPEWLTLLQRKAFKVDYVRMEIEEAIKENKLLVPIQILGASLPPRDELPEELHPLLDAQSAALLDTESESEFNQECSRIINQVRDVLTRDMLQRCQPCNI